MQNMDIIQKLPITFGNSREWLIRFGQQLWESICDAVQGDNWFTTRQVALAIGLNPDSEAHRRYIRLVFMYVREESGDEVLVRNGNFYRWA